LFYSLSTEWVQLLNLVAVLVIPTVVAIVTRENATSRVKALTLAGLTALLTIVTGVVDDGGFTVFGLVNLFVQNVVTAVAFYYGIGKPTGLAGAGSPPSKVPFLLDKFTQ
jgi:hypothetical protein